MESVPNTTAALHDVQVSATSRQRRFTATYKLSIVRQADACTKLGEIWALLRRERLYSSHLTDWRRAREKGELLKPPKVGRPPKAVDPSAKRIAELERQLAKATARAEHAEALVELQKEAAALLGRRWGATRHDRGRQGDGPQAGLVATCAALGLPRATFYRNARPPKVPRQARSKPKQTLPAEERSAVLEVLHEDRFVDLAPAEVYAQLLDEDTYLFSIRTMYRVLAENAEVRERRRQRLHPPYQKPELLATGPNQVWSWDITKLLGPQKWTYFYLYVLLDIFSRYVVGWLIAERESADLAKRLIAKSCTRQGIEPGQLVIHADRGAAMTSKTLAQTMGTLGVTKSHSRPHVSDDNPFSEAQFKTLKYRPDFPPRFDSVLHGERHAGDFFAWYNHEHHHVNLGLMPPHDIHYGLPQDKWHQRAQALLRAYQAHPERFPRGVPTPPPLPMAAWINKPSATAASAEPAAQRALPGAQAGGAVVLARMPDAAGADGLSLSGGTQ